jgi:outer membrane protein assembly factor BamA
MRPRNWRSPTFAPRLAAIAAAILVSLATTAPAGLTTIPIPEYITDPNEGTTIGFLPLLLLTDPEGRLEHFVASDLRFNRTTGWFPSFRLFGYPTSRQRYVVELRKSQKIDEEYDAEYENTDLLDGTTSVIANADYVRDSLQRFFGFGNDSAMSGESNHTVRRFSTQLGIARRLGSFELQGQGRFANVGIGRGGVRRLPFTGELHPGTLGLGGSTIAALGFGLSYDTRDARNLPTRGTLAAARTERVDRALGASQSYTRLGFELRRFIPFHDRFVLAGRAELTYLLGADQAPFFERSQIGGRESVRGFGDGRFVDDHRFLANAELRTRVLSREIFDLPVDLELAPFVDAGRVFGSLLTVPLASLHVAGGLGFRAVVRPTVVGYVDLGYGSEGLAAFSGIDYPF